MKKSILINYYITAILFTLFLIFTVMVLKIDVEAIGPERSYVGFSGVNQLVFTCFNVNLFWYHLTDWLGLVAICLAFVFTLFGLYQLIKYRSLKCVDIDILLLGSFYLAVIGFYILFEKIIINHRPILIEGKLSASYPSSHTMIIVSIMITSMMQFHHRIKKKPLLWTIDLFSVLIVSITILGRLISGVHWLTDIIGGLLLSGALIMLYHSVNTHCRIITQCIDQT